MEGSNKASLGEDNRRRSQTRMSQTRISVNDLDTIDNDFTMSPDYGFSALPNNTSKTFDDKKPNINNDDEMDVEWNIPPQNHRRSVHAQHYGVPNSKVAYTDEELNHDQLVFEEVKKFKQPLDDDYDDKNQISGVSYSPFFINEIKEEEKGE